MRLLTISCFLSVLLSTVPATAQNESALCINEKMVTAQESGLDSLTMLLTDQLNDKDFYLVGESHTMLANNDFQFALIKALHKKGVYYIANELPHATCFIFNQYLESGDENLLSSLKPHATYELLKKVRAFNLMQPDHARIKYYGIDYLDAKYDYNNLQLSLTIIRGSIPSAGTLLDKLIDEYLQKSSFTAAEISGLNQTVSDALRTDSALYRNHFKKYYDDLLLMSGNIIRYEVNRDKKIFSSFLQLYRQLALNSSAKPKFLAFYGIGHLDNLGKYLLTDESSPVRNNVNMIAMHYVNCMAGWTDEKVHTTGIYTVSKKTLKEFEHLCQSGSWKVGLLTDTGCFKYTSGKRPHDAIIVFNSYGKRKMTSWKFD